jgi:hypothetical protein
LAIAYSAAPFFLLGAVWTCWGSAFYLTPESGYNLKRLAWCIASSFLGFAALAFLYCRNEDSPFPSYVTYYPAALVASSSLVFAACHLFAQSSNFVFYPLSFGACVILALYIDRPKDLPGFSR